MKSALQPADVDAELERGGRNGGLKLLVVFHDLFGGLAVRGGEVAVVYQKSVALLLRLAVLPQGGGDSLALFARVDENKALFAARVLENVADTGVSGVGSAVGDVIKLGQGVGYGFAVGSLRALNVKMLHRKPPLSAFILDLRDDRAPARARREKFASLLRVADSRRKPYPPRVYACHSRKPLDKAERLPAAVATHKRMHFVDHDESQVAEKP